MSKFRSRTLVPVAAAASLSLVLAACGGDDTDSSASPKTEGKVTLEFWSWTDGIEAQTKVWNKEHPETQIKFVNAAGETAYQKLRAAANAGTAPCLSKMDGMNLANFAADGLLTDITEVAGQYKGKYTVAAWNAVSPGGTTFGIPMGSSPLFTAYRADLFEKYGIEAPKTWDDLIAAGKKVQAKDKDVKIYNMAGEDPSTLVDLSWSAGAQWYKVDGDHWVVDFTSPEALAAGKIVQQLVDDDLASNASYADPGVFKTWDLGTTIAMTTSTWQLPIYDTNFPKSKGKWQLADAPVFDTAKPQTSSNFDTTAVLKGCKYPDRAAEFAAWLSSSKESLTALTDPASKSGLFPAVTDVSPYVDKIIPTEMFNGKSDSAEVITTAASRVGEQWQYGPNYAAMYSEMQKQWGKVMKKELTVEEMLRGLQKWTVDDLNGKGIKAVAAG
ncbi:sugar ABC transporter substrate-binding protein [Streptomyces ipomoeae]|uniref:ABC transporter, substrate-binding protein n=1 Tax=Streptomyces ipomoeae 91-03 TaxID=698759 RepID=L1KUG1_9ACTN|nr:sugar ABC transporter substrate-binding protein [Streptomyces ipomoeae]EKX64436.1 ABC transporter, substrate-binding protein [Streptomyces ipomoeae 91-03]MDX2697436.1 sugar ABC transporter substrate-binding protein [Streptomyces ipomoeae]MDX2828619.1 sugar ABC transporter substrate-binding protein [Streptomyces ipomoeae]MDX2843190.1 sugar ABC transporter substrate-binding protein [Streptomyces ipomoeae]MDX2935975.1 sugar ABC transporter substrate-binding protein [Streptomyces ipomoeae]